MVDLSLAPASLKEEFKTEIRSMRVLCTYVSGRYGGKNAEVQEDDEKAFMFCLEVLDKTLLENKEKSIISDVPETCILSIVRVGDRFYDLHQKTVSTGVVVSFVTENLVGVIFDSDRTYHIFPAYLFGNRFVYVRIRAIILFLPSYFCPDAHYFHFVFPALLGYTRFLKRDSGCHNTDTSGDDSNSCSFQGNA
jgi:hypothetical protein